MIRYQACDGRDHWLLSPQEAVQVPQPCKRRSDRREKSRDTWEVSPSLPMPVLPLVPHRDESLEDESRKKEKENSEAEDQKSQYEIDWEKHQVAERNESSVFQDCSVCRYLILVARSGLIRISVTFPSPISGVITYSISPRRTTISIYFMRLFYTFLSSMP